MSKEEYPDFVTSTGYGTVTGLCGVNCYHDFYPFIPGISERTYTDEQLEEMNREENTPKEFAGKQYTKYEALQRQRRLETTMRAQKQKINLLEVGGADDETLTIAKVKYRTVSYEYTRFSKAMGLPQQRERVRVSGDFVPKVGAKKSGSVTADERLELLKNPLTNKGEGSIIKSIDIDDFKMMSEGRDIDPKAIDTISDVIRKYEKSGDIYINDFYFGSLSSDSNGTPLLQIEPIGNKMIRLNVNTDIFVGKTVTQIDDLLKSNTKNLASSLEEAVIHECGHAKSLKGKTIKEIQTMYSEIANAHIEDISKIAYNDGAEALAEIEILISRGGEVPEKAMEFYNKYMRGNR